MTPLTGKTRTTALLGMAALALCLAAPGSVSAGNYTAQPAAKSTDDKAAKPAAPYTAITPPGYTAKTVQPVVPRSTTAGKTQTDVELEKINKQYEKDLRDALKSQMNGKLQKQTGLGGVAFLDGLGGISDLLKMLNRVGDPGKMAEDFVKSKLNLEKLEKITKTNQEAATKNYDASFDLLKKTSPSDPESPKIVDNVKKAANEKWQSFRKWF